MGLLDEFKNQMNADNSKVNDTNLPWNIIPENNLKDNSDYNSWSTKKIATVGIAVLIAIISLLAIFNFINNINSVNVETNTNTNENNNDLRKIQVHVAGEVIKPGVYKIDEGSRIMDAVNAAGGFTSKADQNSLNLAKVLEDGEQILISSTDTAIQTQTGEISNNNGKVNINTADLSQLQTLNGVGPSTAQKIIDYRNANGKFKTIEDIKKVSGIGEKTYEKFKDMICV